MPYTGLPNPEVMQLVTNGGRLGTPPGCPPVIYKIMADCWNPTPEDRPTFSSLLERLKAVTEVNIFSTSLFILLTFGILFFRILL